MKKRLNVDLVQNELKGGSAFFPGYKSTTDAVEQEEPQSHSPTLPPAASTEPKPALPQTSPVPLVRGVPPVRDVPPVPLKRVMKQRWPVDIYQDQYESLQRLALEERKQGGVGSMSAMVREALDWVIAKRQKK